MLLMIIIVFILVGSIIAIFRSPDAGPFFRIGGTNSRGESANNNAAAQTDLSIFNGIGMLRIPVAGQNSASSATMIISIAFPYPPGDLPWTEELASKIANFKTITFDYFSSLPASAIANLNEENAKAELLRRYNAILRLGKIESLYFSDLTILE